MIKEVLRHSLDRKQMAGHGDHRRLLKVDGMTHRGMGTSDSILQKLDFNACFERNGSDMGPFTLVMPLAYHHSSFSFIYTLTGGLSTK